MRQILNRYFHVIFAGIFFALTGYLAIASPLWADESVYLELAQHILSAPLRPFDSMLTWVPHPPLGWYLFAAFSFMPRLASISTSILCAYFLYHMSKKLHGEDIAKLSVISLLSTLGYMLYSSIAHLDGPLTAFMTLSVFSFLVWIKLGNHKYLLFSGLNLGLASMTKYTAAPILLGTFILWLVLIRKKVSRSTFFEVMAVLAVSLVPLAIWTYNLSIFYGNFIRNYSEIYGLFPREPPIIAINLIVYTANILLLWGLPFLSWIRKRPFDSDMRLLLIYAIVLFVFFVLITPMEAIIYQHQNRYLLPLVPATTLISAKSLIEEKSINRFVILVLQFIGVTLFALLMLLYPPFSSFTSDLYSQLLGILGISGE